MWPFHRHNWGFLGLTQPIPSWTKFLAYSTGKVVDTGETGPLFQLKVWECRCGKQKTERIYLTGVI